jgi:alanyl-tRNA synthetase
VNIDNWDVEACGGTHVKSTGDIGLIKIVKSERIQDGVVRLEFVAGEAAVNFMQQQEGQIAFIAQTLGSSREKVVESFTKAIEDGEAAKRKLRTVIRVVAKEMAESAISRARQTPSGVKVYAVHDEELDEEYHIAIGEKAIEMDPGLVYVALLSKDQAIRVIVFAGEAARKSTKAGIIAKQVSAILGGSGGGNDRFGQGGGRSKEKIKEAMSFAEQASG